MIAALVIGTVLAVGALAFVLYPVFFGVARQPQVVITPRLNEGESAIAALREIEFDRATGKLSEADYAELKARYTKEAIAVMRRQQESPAGAADDEIEARTRANRLQLPAIADQDHPGLRPLDFRQQGICFS